MCKGELRENVVDYFTNLFLAIHVYFFSRLYVILCTNLYIFPVTYIAKEFS